MDQSGEFGLRVSVTVPPIFKPLQAGRVPPDEGVVDWSVFPVGHDGVEEACIDVLVYCEFFVSDGGGEWFLCHGFLLSFVRCREVEEFLHEFIAFLGELPSPAWPVVSADAVSVDAVDVS